ncbi:MAG: FG-GAP-like repeat-containing protein, partial [Bacteroidota bacterium]
MIRLTYTMSTLRFLFAMLFLVPVMSQAFGQNSPFRKINSGTKADIRTIILDNQQGVYFLTDKIYRLDKDAWKKLDFPVEGKIYGFYPLTPQDVWFTVIPYTSTCMLYHFHDGITEHVRPPFANYITALHFFSENSALLASIADMAVYENGTFRMLPPSPARYNIVKISGVDPSDFWLLTEGNELFHYTDGSYSQVFKTKKVTCFSFNDLMNGYVVANDELYLVSGSELKLMIKSPVLSKVVNAHLLENHSLMMVGEKGLLVQYINGRLLTIQSPCAENLLDIFSSGSGNIWVCGKNGCLLYAGLKQFPAYVEDNGGFSSHKLSSVGLNADGEYGVAIADFNGDGKNDIYTVRLYEQNRLYINNLALSDMVPYPHGFTEEVVKRNANGEINPENRPAQNELKLGVCAADIDNDGDQDIYLCYLNSVNKLLLNTGKGIFRNVSAQKGRACDNMERSNAAVFADVDNDGDLDLFVTSEKGTNRLFENNGTGHFTDITVSSGLVSSGGGMCASLADVNNDGYPDLCVSFWNSTNRLYLNEPKYGSIHFRDITSLTDLASATPSKSNTNRALLLAALAEGKSKIIKPLFCDDSISMHEALENLGVIIKKGINVIEIERT